MSRVVFVCANKYIYVCILVNIYFYVCMNVCVCSFHRDLGRNEAFNCDHFLKGFDKYSHLVQVGMDMIRKNGLKRGRGTGKVC